jgi:prevent-host-death family protein
MNEDVDSMERRLSATEARVHFGELLRRIAESGETVIVERGGTAAAAIVPIVAYERWKAAASPQSWRDALERARQVRSAMAPKFAAQKVPTLDEIIHAARQERDAQLTGRR